MILIGELSLWVALLMATWGTAVGFAGGHYRRPELIASAERASYATFGFLLLAALGLWTALVHSDFSFRYVASYTSANLPSIYKVTAFWAGQSGSLLLWAFILSGYSAIAVWTNRSRNREFDAVRHRDALRHHALFCGDALLRIESVRAARLDSARRHRTQSAVAESGDGDPSAESLSRVHRHGGSIRLRDRGADHATTRRRVARRGASLDAGFVVLQHDGNHPRHSGGRTSSSAGAATGRRDPVENASFLPWLVNTAFLHSIMVQEKRGMLRKWNVTLVVSAFLLAILGTFITRSGIISSVHSFAQSNVGYWFLGFLVFSIAVTAYLVSTRLNDLEAKAELARTAWESALAADALRERVFELRYPSRFLDGQAEECTVAGPRELRELAAQVRDA